MSDIDKVSPGQPKNITDITLLARELYGQGKKNQAIGAICDGLILLAAGVKRGFMDHEAAITRDEALNKRLTQLEERVKLLEEGR